MCLFEINTSHARPHLSMQKKLGTSTNTVLPLSRFHDLFAVYNIVCIYIYIYEATRVDAIAIGLEAIATRNNNILLMLF